MVMTSLMGAFSPNGHSARLSILIFHRVLPAQDPLFPDEPDVNRFDEVLRWVTRWFQVLPLDMAVMQLRAGTLPARAAAITFDDGYADNATHALPVLQRHGVSATFFVATSFLDGGRMWNDTVIEAVRGCRAESLDLREVGLGRLCLASVTERRVAIESILGTVKYLAPAQRNQVVAWVERAAGVALPSDLMMRASQVVALRHAGMQVGAHTETHPILASLPDADARAEISGGKSALESILGERVSLFAYPNGKPGKDYFARHAEMVRHAGFDAAVSTAAGAASVSTDPFQLPRFTPWDRTELRYGLRMMLNFRVPPG